MKTIKFRIAFYLLLIPFACFSQSLKPMADTIAFKSGLEMFSKNTHSIQSDFIQEKKLKMLNDKVISKGQLFFKKENKLRWEYDEPYKYIVAMNNGKVMLLDEGKVTTYDANANKLFLELNDILMTCINGNIFQTKKFSFKFMETDKNKAVEMTPLNSSMKNFIDRIILYFDADFSVAKAEMLEPSKNSTIIIFKNKKLNAEIPENLFILK